MALGFLKARLSLPKTGEHLITFKISEIKFHNPVICLIMPAVPEIISKQ
jgi:hypothetical protein